MKDLSENIHWGLTIKTFFIYLGKCFYVPFSSNGALFNCAKYLECTATARPPRAAPAGTGMALWLCCDDHGNFRDDLPWVPQALLSLPRNL
jgi:hypothetical protein